MYPSILTALVTPMCSNMLRDRIGNAAAMPKRTKTFIAKALFALVRCVSIRYRLQSIKTKIRPQPVSRPDAAWTIQENLDSSDV